MKWNKQRFNFYLTLDFRRTRNMILEFHLSCYFDSLLSVLSILLWLCRVDYGETELTTGRKESPFTIGHLRKWRDKVDCWKSHNRCFFFFLFGPSLTTAVVYLPLCSGSWFWKDDRDSPLQICILEKVFSTTLANRSMPQGNCRLYLVGHVQGIHLCFAGNLDYPGLS